MEHICQGVGWVKQVRVEVVRQEGVCGAGHKPGDTWVCGGMTVDGICAAAYASFYPTLRALASGGEFRWAEQDGSVEIACPDGANPAIFRLTPQ